MPRPGGRDGDIRDERSGEVTGVVTAFDEAKGYGAVRDDDGGTERFFHCTAIADGSRTIEVGTAVTYEIVPGRLGQWEATDLRPSASP